MLTFPARLWILCASAENKNAIIKSIKFIFQYFYIGYNDSKRKPLLNKPRNIKCMMAHMINLIYSIIRFLTKTDDSIACWLV